MDEKLINYFIQLAEIKDNFFTRVFITNMKRSL